VVLAIHLSGRPGQCPRPCSLTGLQSDTVQPLKDMKIKEAIAVFGLLFAGALAVVAQDQGYWRAASTNARSITGDITLSETSVVFNFTAFTIAPIRTLKTTEVAAVFDADVNSGVKGNLYRLSIPSERRFLHKNTLCGTESAQWMATFVSGRNLQVALFSGLDEPVFTFDGLANSSTRCATFTYAR
jgi:hypothetical protein